MTQLNINELLNLKYHLRLFFNNLIAFNRVDFVLIIQNEIELYLAQHEQELTQKIIFCLNLLLKFDLFKSWFLAQKKT